MTMIPDRHSVNGGYDYNKLPERDKGILDGYDYVLGKVGEPSMIETALDNYEDELTGLNLIAFKELKQGIIEAIETHIDCDANMFFTSMCEHLPDED